MPRTVKEINTLLNKIRLQTAEILKQKTQIIAILLFDRLCWQFLPLNLMHLKSSLIKSGINIFNTVVGVFKLIKKCCRVFIILSSVFIKIFKKIVMSIILKQMIILFWPIMVS